MYVRYGYTVPNYLTTLSTKIMGIGYSIGNTYWMPNCSPIWFLTSLFCADLIFYFIRRFRLNVIWIFFILILGYNTTKPAHMPWNIGSAMVGAVFMWIAYKVKAVGNIKTNIFLVLIPILLSVIIFFGLPSVNMDEHKYSNYPLFILTSTCICLLLMISAKAILKRNKIPIVFQKNVEFISTNALFLFGYNYSANAIIGHLFNMWLFNFLFVLFSLIVGAFIINKIGIKKYFI